MPVANPAVLPETPIPGISHLTLACRGEGLESLSVWKQTIAPGQGTPPHSHDCEEVVVVLDGQGTLSSRGEQLSFGPGSTLLLPANEEHQIVNTGTRPLTMVAAFATTPVATFAPDGASIELPWRS